MGSCRAFNHRSRGGLHRRKHKRGGGGANLPRADRTVRSALDIDHHVSAQFGRSDQSAGARRCRPHRLAARTRGHHEPVPAPGRAGARQGFFRCGWPANQSRPEHPRRREHSRRYNAHCPRRRRERGTTPRRGRDHSGEGHHEFAGVEHRRHRQRLRAGPQSLQPQPSARRQQFGVGRERGGESGDAVDGR